MSEVTIKIDGKECKAQEGEFILNVARANDIFIPAICYLDKCSPTLACRLCLVEADEKRVYACNAKAKDGMNVITENPDILEERRAIMEVYDVNHPLQCGVCDQSGECELQNYTLDTKVDSQSYSIPDTKRESVNWSSVLHYDPGLCIVCERCTTVCKDMIGDAAITTGPRGGEKLSKDAKASMPKDAYAMWNKLQKSVIVPSNGTDHTNCSDCGECIAVCPVGALVSRDFQYTSNAWDLKRIPATAAHSSDGFAIYYETKPISISSREEKIYRVTNEWNFVSLDGSARFGYDFENRGVQKDEKAFLNAIDEIKNAGTIRFNSLITNEEALMLQKLKEELGIKLYNPEVRAYQKFLKVYKEASGKSLYSGNPDLILKKTDFVISAGCALRNDAPGSKYAFNNIQKMNKGAGLYFHPIGDTLIESFGKNVMAIEHKAGLGEAVLYLLLGLFGDAEKMPQNIKEVASDTSALVSLLGANPEEFQTSLEKMMKKKEKFALIVGEDFYYHERAENLAKLVALVESACDTDVVIVPPKSNALGVALICDLDDEIEGRVVGYNEPGDFRLSALGDGDLDMPALNQQEGTLTNIAKKVVPTNAALEYGGYELNDLVSEIISSPQETIDWTELLPVAKGYREVKFDTLRCDYGNDGSNNIGYELEVTTSSSGDLEIEDFSENTLDGDIACRCNPPRQFNDFTNKSHQIFEKFGLYVSPQRATTLGEKVIVEFDNGSLELDVIVDDKMSGNIVKVPDFISNKEVYTLFGDRRYKTVTIREV